MQSGVPIGISGVTSLDLMQGENEQETQLLNMAATEAEKFLLSHKWCFGVSQIYFGAGIAGIATVFLCEIVPTSKSVDQWLWVVGGDIPMAYIVTDSCKTPLETLRAYISEMKNWVVLAYEGRTSSKVIPTNVAANAENAALLEKRLQMLSNFILPLLAEGGSQ